MAIEINLPRSNKSVIIPKYSSLEELLFASGKPNLERPATSILMFRRLLAYTELLTRENLPRKDIIEHLQHSMSIYNSITEHESVEPNEVESTIEDRLKEAEFHTTFQPIIDEFISEVFKIFASGAISVDEGDVVVENEITSTRSMSA